MGYRDNLDPARARIAELRDELDRRKERVLPAFWRLPHAQSLSVQVARLGKPPFVPTETSTLVDLVTIEAAYEEALAAFDRELQIARDAEARGAFVPEHPEGKAAGEPIAEVIERMRAPLPFPKRFLLGLLREVQLEALQRIQTEAPRGARCYVREHRGELLVLVEHEDLVYRIPFLENHLRNNRDILTLSTSVPAPVGAPQLHLKPRGAFDGWLDAWGLPRVMTGDELFDELFALSCDQEFAREVFDPPLRRSCLHASRVDEVRLDVVHGWATLHGSPSRHTFEVLHLLRDRLHTERYVRQDG